MSLVISSPVAEVLRKAAGGRDVEEFLLELVASRLDPSERIDVYLALHEKYLREAESLYEIGDLAQAGEKYWGAVTALLNAIAEKRGMPHYSHRDYAVIIEALYAETKDKELLVGFSLAERLHANFYHNFMKRESFELHRDAVLKLVEKLKRFL
ncbi:paREP8 [Pyrobaculum aerophilum str. IM2]|uniref:PaREP8 n=1 Tax=Pyrobaculum aerophilum (strain ATCC 51768 / DSM 7523 / JCM 9630 / CIP 104966 / NBRC 100827 / IM2) TaxID=178306 RepID=Q8ZUP9_PYRAE|nr:PaREP1 family protein [Pyrobaculum aerophilum]AAL64357.1 paREP8 [Pyrobaculum aerophilum str. IM2]